jgi:hypothetical protein
MEDIIAAIVTGIANLSKDAIKDSYNAFKNYMKDKFGEESEVVKAVNEVERKPDSEGRKAILREEMKAAQADEDNDLLKLAQDLITQIKEQGKDTGTPISAENYVDNCKGTISHSAFGREATVNNYYGETSPKKEKDS